jgi:two-component system sensor histidine kinase YcbA
MDKIETLSREAEKENGVQWELWKRVLIVSFCTAILGEMKLNPATLGGTQEFGLGIIAFSFALLFWKDMGIFITAFFTGMTVILIKAIFLLPSAQTSDLVELALKLNWPILGYYITNAFVQTAADIRHNVEKPTYVAAWLFLSDLLATFLEMVLRNEQVALAAGFPTLREMAYAAAFRTAIIVAFFYIIRRRQIVELAEQEKAKYEDLLMLLNGLHAEAFFLKKSAGDIEKTMAKAYALYRTLQNKQKEYERGDKLTLDALDVAKDIHEIKKDYQRIVAGIEKLITAENLGEDMGLEDIISIIFSTNDSYAKRLQKEIVFTSQLNYRFRTKEYHSLISILNNLVSNAVEANELSPGHIQITSRVIGWHIFLTVTDDGPGIEEMDQQIIFAPGYTTKFSGNGMQSTGIGLTHVHSIVQSLGGEVTVESKKGLTAFHLMIPRESLENMLNSEQVEEEEERKKDEERKKSKLPSEGSLQTFSKNYRNPPKQVRSDDDVEPEVKE